MITAPGDVRSVPSLLMERVTATPDAEALRHPAEGGWRSLTWADVDRRVRALAGGLRSLGVGDEDRVAILAGTRVEWILADLAVLAAGCATTTVYPTSTPDECAFVISDSESRVVIAEDAGKLDKLRGVRGRIPAVTHVVVMDPDGVDLGDDWVLSLDDLAARGEEWNAAHPGEYERTAEAIGPDQLATLIYTSGTTGRPKGVELTHRNWTSTAAAVAQLGILRPDDLHFLWLPMSHSFAKVLEVSMIAVGPATAVDGRVERIAANLAELRPTVVAAAPRIFEKIHNTVVSTIQAEGGVKLRLFRWAIDVGSRVVSLQQAGRSVPPLLRAQHALADRLVLSKLRARFGGRIRYFVSGSAPLSEEMAVFFGAAGITILEGYGLTESSAASFVNRPESVRFGTVGPPLPGTEVKIAEDGEILVRSPGVMRGYHGLPEETAATLVDGWLQTGDIGEVDGQGRLRITDRKKELIKTSGGKYVAPQHLEGRIKAACPYLSQVLVHGDRRNYCTALVTLDLESIAGWAQQRGLPADPAGLATDPQVRTMVGEAINQVNAGLARHETVKRFAIITDDFAVETGELTPSLKIRRRVVEDRYSDVLDGLYEGTVHRISPGS